MLAALKQIVEKSAGDWFVVVELKLQAARRNPKRLDVLLLHAAARSWSHSIAIEIDPLQHGPNPMMRGSRNREAALQRADKSDDEKAQLCSHMGMHFFSVTEQSVCDGGLAQQWAQLLHDDMLAIEAQCKIVT